MQTPQVIEKKTLEKLVQQKLLSKKNESEYYYHSKNHYIEMLFSPGDLLLPPERQSLGSHTVEHTVASLVNQARDMLDCYAFYQTLSAEVDHQWFSEDLKSRIDGVSKNSHASTKMLSDIAKQYYQFLNFGYPTWEHVSVAKKYGISVQTLKKYLKAMKLYDSSKHQGNTKINQKNQSEAK